MSDEPDESLTLHPTKPFNFDMSCGIYNRVESYTHTAYLESTLYKCIEHGGGPVLIAIREERDGLRARLYGLGTNSWLKSITEWITSSSLDLIPFYARADGVMKYILDRLRGLKPPRTATVYEALIIAITEQQISLRVASALQERIVKRYGEVLNHGAYTFYSFPKPAALAAADQQELRSLGLSKNKVDFIVGISKSISSGELNLEELKDKSTVEAREELQSIRGVGEWTSDYVLVRGLGRLEMVPYDDLGTRDSVGLFYSGGVRATRGEVEEILGRFGEYAGLANYYLIYARFFGINPGPT